MDTIDRVTTVLIADLSGSTALYERLGDREAHAVVAGILDRWTRVVQGRSGLVIKTMGDGLLATIDDPADAARVAVDLHRTVDERGGADRMLNAYVAFQSGAVVERSGDIFGDAVNVTARLTELAKPRQILTTGETAKALPGWSIRSLGRTPVRGRTAEVELVELIWEQHLVTTVVRSRAGNATDTVALELTGAAGARVVVDRGKPEIRVGRMSYNDVVIDGETVSRLHARIEFRQSRFILIDESSNGTHIFQPGRGPKVLHHDELELGTQGLIGLGTAPTPNAPTTLAFRSYVVEPQELG